MNRKDGGKKNRLWCAAIILAMVLVMGISGSAKAASIKLNKTKVTLDEGSSTTIKVNGTKKKATFKSSKKTVATVSKSGTIKGKKAGKCTITVKVGKKTLTCSVTVKKRVEVKDYINKPFSKFQKAANLRTGFNEDPLEEKTLYFSKEDKDYFFARKDAKTEKLSTLQNSGLEYVTVYGVKLGDKLSAAAKKLGKYGFKQTKIRKVNMPKFVEWRDYRKSDQYISLAISAKGKVVIIQWYKD